MSGGILLSRILLLYPPVITISAVSYCVGYLCYALVNTISAVSYYEEYLCYAPENNISAVYYNLEYLCCICCPEYLNCVPLISYISLLYPFILKLFIQKMFYDIILLMPTGITLQDFQQFNR